MRWRCVELCDDESGCVVTRGDEADMHLAAFAATVAVPRASITCIRTPRICRSETVRECLWAAATAVANPQVHGEPHDVVCSHPAVLL